VLAGIEAIVFRTIGDRPSLWESRLPPEVLRLPEQLSRVDALLGDPAFFAPFAPRFHLVLGRPSTPVECYLRLMFLKFRYRLGYESLCAEVSDSVSWRRFCGIPLDGRVPHPTTLMKLTTRCGDEAVAGLSEALRAKAAGAKLLRTARVRADTAVIAANVACPVGAGLLAKAVGKLVRAARRVQAAGGATGTVMTGRRRAAGRRHGRWLPRCAPGLSWAGTRRAGRSAGRPETWLIWPRPLPGTRPRCCATAAGRCGGPWAGRVRGRLRRAPGELTVTIERTATVVSQARSRLAGQMPDGATRLVSLHDPEARPIRKGRIDRPVEFGYQAQVTGNDYGIILDYGVAAGNPPDAPQLAPAISRIARRAGRTPDPVTADRGYGGPATERELQALGVCTVAIARRARPSTARRAAEHARGFRALVKWRTGCEGRISYLKRGYGWDRTRLDGRDGASIWCGHGVSSHNLVKISALAS